MEELETPPLPEVPEESSGALEAAGSAPAEAAARVEETMAEAEPAPPQSAEAEAAPLAEVPEESAATPEPAGIPSGEAMEAPVAAESAEAVPQAVVPGRPLGPPALVPTLTFDIASQPPTTGVETNLDTAGMSACATPVGGQVSMEELLTEAVPPAPHVEDAQLRAVLEAIIYVAEEPLTLAQLSAALHEPAERIRTLLEQLAAEYDKPEHGITVREVAGGYKMATKPEHHEGVRSFVKSLKPPLKLSLPALETLAVIAYKQPVTAPEIMEIRGVQGAGVLKTLLDRKLIGVAGRKNVIGKPILYRTTKDFLIQFGLKDMSELPSLKEFEEIRRMALSEGDVPTPEPASEPPAEQTGEPADAAGKHPGLFHVKQFSQPAVETPEAGSTPAAEPAPELAPGPAPGAPAQPAGAAGRPPEAAPVPAARQSSGPAPAGPARPSAEAAAQLPDPAAEAPEPAPAPAAGPRTEPVPTAQAQPAEVTESAPAAGPPADQEP
ncbi:MAG: SMC-Scp complex subunit ScpB [Bryobacteraceae bacterium]